MSATPTKTRNWSFIVYPESAPANWLEMLEDMHVKALVSPLHDRDVTEDGEVKKPHYHVIVMYDGPITARLMQERVSVFNGPAHVEAVHSLQGSARYLIHRDNPEKYQYSAADVLSFGGVDYMEVMSSNSDRTQAIIEMERWCDENQCISFVELCRYARDFKPDWHRYLTSSATVFMKEYVRSLDWDKKTSQQTSQR